MATVTKLFTFLSNAESFVPTAAAQSTLAWDGTVGNPAGALKARVLGRNATNANYWEWTGTWEALGVPAGATVTAIQLTSGWTRVTEYNVGAASTIGPYTLRNASGTTTGTLWSGRTASGTDAGTAIGSQTAVSGLSDSSDTTIKIRLEDTLKTANNASAAVTAYDDQVNLTITYTPAPSTVSSNFTANAILRATYGDVPTADAILKATSSATFTADAVIAAAGGGGGGETVYLEDHMSVDGTPGLPDPDTVGPSYTTSGGTSAEYGKGSGYMGASSPSAVTRTVRNALTSSQADVRVTGRWHFPSLTGSGSVAYARFQARGQGNESDTYEFRLSLTAAGVVACTINRRNAGVSTTVASSTTAFSGYTVTDWVQFKYEIQGSSPVALRFKAWKDGTSEPGTWTIDTTDTDAVNQITAAGTWSVVFQPLAGYTGTYPVEHDLDDIKVASISAGPAPTTQSGSFTADSILRKTVSSTLTSDAILRVVQTGSLVASGFIGIDQPVWSSPANGATTSTTPTLVFVVHGSPTSLQLEMDTVNTFNSGNKRTYTSGFSVVGSTVTFVVPDVLPAGTWYYRARGGV